MSFADRVLDRLPWRDRQATAFLGLGSNLGDRLANLRSALTDLDALDDLDVEVVSAVYETDPVTGGEDVEQDRYLNLVAGVITTLRPHDLLQVTQTIEAAHGRDRRQEQRWGPRTLDIDLLLFEHHEIDDPDLTIPHPRLTERAFVLVPLAEVLPPGATLPDGTSVASHLARLAPLTGIDLHVRLVEGPGTSSEPLLHRPRGPQSPPPTLGERRGGPGQVGPRRPGPS